MPAFKYRNDFSAIQSSMTLREEYIETSFIDKLSSLKYTYRPDIHDRETLGKNFRENFEELNHVRLTDAEFARLQDEIITSDVFTASKTLRSINAFTRDDGVPLNYTLVRGGIRGVRHKLLIFHCAEHAFDFIKRKNLPRILAHWVWRSCRGVIAMRC